MTSPPQILTVRTAITQNAPHGGLPLSIHDPDDLRRTNGGSVISSRMTDISDNASDIMGLAEAQQSQSQSQSSPRNSTGRSNLATRISVGDMMDSFSTRPSTAMSGSTSPTGLWPVTPNSNTRNLPSVGGSSVRARPSSSKSRTHAPGLANPSFYRPMSSAKLQAQRGKVTEEDEELNRIRGFALASPMNQLPPPIPPMPPVLHHQGHRSSGTRDASISTLGNTIRTVPSLNSNSPLRQDTEHRNKRPDDPRCSGANVSRMPNAGDGSSNGSRSSAVIEKQRIFQRKHRQKPGKNYEYFPGNTRFFFGGRLQTARDFPMNIMTAILVILPAGLFFGFS